jgi:phosphoribosylformylglycinamidine synthase subunit PurSL
VEVGHRLTIRSAGTDPRGDAIAEAAEQLGLATGLHGSVEVADVVLVDGELTLGDLRRLESLLVDPLLQTGSWDVPTATGIAYEIAPLPGVTDVDAATVMAAAARLGLALDRAASARRVEFDRERLDQATADEIIERVVANPIVERWANGVIEPGPIDHSPDVPPADTVPMRDLTPEALASLGKERSLALDPEELVTIQAHFSSIGRDPTDVELETLAQTWSEHCAHKSFRAIIDADDGVERPPLLRALRDATDTIDAPFVRSSFVGNAGIVSFSDGVTVALKAETHNHPSAVEPFGGANTGVGGVIRDVLGAAHRPIAITDVLCFGHPDLALDDVPHGSLHPRRIREGVIDGVADYGNKIGLPTVAGAILYDEGFTTNPLVFAGCIGTAAERDAHTGPHPGDRVVVLGGRTGRDGIRGATFSSLTMDATTGEVAGASVQIGDPITEKLLIDVLTGADHLYSAITDCGAGGLSSAVGEMAEAIGADVDLSLAPLKYAGLAPWEIWLSEAQERMVVAVSPEHLPAMQARCDRYGVELADLGAFTGDGRLLVRYRGTVVLDLDTEFLHDGRPQRRLRAVMPSPDRHQAHTARRAVDDPYATLLALLRHRNIASKAGTIHRYDHEIRGTTVVRPVVGRELDGPGDGVVLAEPTDRDGIAIGIGVNPWYGMHDPEAMARAVVDEAIRNVVAVGADPDRVALLDNFSWGDPRDPATFGELVAAVEGCCTAALAHRAPFVSGKDSLNNTYETTDGTRHAVPPTLVITAVAHVPDVERCVTSDLEAPGNLLVVVGSTAPEFAGSHLDLVLGSPDVPGPAPQVDPAAPERFRRLHRAIGAGLVRACHDLSEGGFAVAMAEMCIAGRLGADIHTLPHPDPVTGLFSESTSRFVVEVAPNHLDEFVDVLDDAVQVVGTVTAEPVLTLPEAGSVDLEVLVAAFNRESS